ncbi:MAG: primosomal protein N' [Candidatus Izemoplasma sp.]|nr:primosomal protein N' [Candidatus Izemoplasma sp.]
MIASVLVDIKVHQVDQTYDYRIPLVYEELIDIGMRVIVPFGRRKVMGYVLDIKAHSEYDRLKNITRLIDLSPTLTPELIRLAKDMSYRNISPLVSNLQAMLPSALKSSYTKYVTIDNKALVPSHIKSIFRQKKRIKLSEIDNTHHKDIKRLEKDGALSVVTEITQKYQKRYQDYIVLMDSSISVRGKKQQAVIDYLKNHKKVLKKTLVDVTDAPYSTLTSLQSKGIIDTLEEETYRTVDMLTKPLDKDITLNTKQEAAYHQIKEAINQYDVFLLHGVTGSGKTEIYLNLIEEVVNKGQEAIVLVPEISLTPMMMSRFRGRFKDDVAVLHSHLSIGEKYDEWRKIKRQEVHVVVGARSAVFAPFTNLGMIIIDEEHSDTYKQDSAPTYHAIDVAKMRAKTYDIPLVLGSATPQIESYYHALNGRYHLLELPERANQTTLPDVYIEDMTEEFKSGNRSILSRRLHTLIQDRLDKNEQMMLLLNRRGHSTFVMCRSCGEVIMCPNCDISLTYHERDNHLKCHYCGHETSNPSVCPSCQSTHIRYMGIGTEKVQELIEKMFPSARVIRMDRDTTTRKNSHEKLLHEFEHKGDILIGTQMIAKGLDYPNVTLVGVLAADMSLHLPDYKAIEKTFQLLTQVSGRAGRHQIQGEVVIQTYNEDHYAIQYAKRHDYIGFYKEEIAIRELSGYRPIKQLVQIIVSDQDVKKVLKIGTKIVLKIRKDALNNPQVLGPVLPKVARINNRYRAQIIIKYEEEHNIHDVLQNVYDTYHDECIIAIDRHPNLL